MSGTKAVGAPVSAQEEREWAGWLAALGSLLMKRDVLELALVEGVELPSRVDPRERWPDEARVLMGTPPERTPAAGLLIALGDGQGRSLWLGLAHHAPTGSDDVAMAALLERSIPAYRDSGVRDAIHALRNALNGVSMCAAALDCAGLSSDQQWLLDDLRRSVGDGLQTLSRLTVVLPVQK